MSDLVVSQVRSKVRNRLNIEWDTAIVGDGSGNVNDPYWIGSGRVLVRFLTDNGYSTPTLVRGPSRQLATSLTEDLNIKIKYDNHEPYIDDVDVHAAVISNTYPVQNPPTSIGSGDASTQDQLSTLRCSQDSDQPSLFVNLSSWVPIINKVAYNFPGESVDLSSFVPSTGLHCVVVIFVTDDYASTEVFASTPIPLVDDLTVEIDLNEALALSSDGSTPAWSYDVRGDVDTILDTDTFLDARQMVNNAASSATGDVSGPATSTDNAVARFDGATGKQIQNSGVLIDDSNNMTVPGIVTTQSGKVRKTRVVTAAGAVTVTTADDIVSINKTVGAATTVNLPATPTTGQTFEIHDGRGDAATNNITITPAAGNINGASTLVLTIAYASALVTYNGTQWDATIAVTGSGGNVSGPVSSTDRAIASWNGTGGNTLRDNPNALVDANGNVTANEYKLPTAQAATLSSDAFTMSKGFVVIASESGTADDLKTISGGSGNVFVLIQPASGHTITVKNGTGNIFLNAGADYALSGDKALLLFYDGTNWADLATLGSIAVQNANAVVITGGTLDGVTIGGSTPGAVTASLWKLGSAQAATLSSDAFTMTKSYAILTSQSGTADDLATINGGSGNVFIVLQPASGHTITVKNGTGNIFLNAGADYALSGDKTLLLFYDGTNWADLDTLGSMAVQNANAVVITGGTINGTTIGATTPSTAIFSALALLIGGFKAIFTQANTADHTVTFQDADGTVAYTDKAGQGYVRTGPAADSDNVISVATTTIRALALKTTDNNTTKKLLEFLSSAGAVLASIGATGLARFAGIDNTPIGATTPSTVKASQYQVVDQTELTESSDAITITQVYHTVKAETGTTDNLATINGGGANSMILILQAKATHTITIKNGTGNIFLNSGTDYALSGDKTLLLFYDGTNWADTSTLGSMATQNANAVAISGGAMDGTTIGATTPANVTAAFLKLPAGTQLSIVSDAVTVTQSFHTLHAQTGTADDLATVNGGTTQGQIIGLMAKSTDTITLKSATGNLSLTFGADIVLSGQGVVFLYWSGIFWVELWYSRNVPGNLISGTVSATNLGIMTGASSGVNGVKGAVPQPLAGQNVSALFGDAVWAGAARKIVDYTTLGSDTANIDLTSISGDYKSLLLLLYLRSDRAATSDNVYLRFNNDSTAANYYSYTVAANGSTVAFTSVQRLAATGTGFEINLGAVGNTGPSNEYSYLAVQLFGYTDSFNKNRIVKVDGYSRLSTTGGTLNQLMGGGSWLNTSNAISRITILPVTGSNWKTGSAYMLYGLS